MRPLTNAKAAVVKALPIEEKEVVFVMDRFGYSKILDKNTYERNEETVLKEYRHIVHCMNTDKICVFTDTGVMHQIKVQDIPSGRLRDKGTPLDNIGNYDISLQMSFIINRNICSIIMVKTPLMGMHCGNSFMSFSGESLCRNCCEDKKSQKNCGQ